MRLMNESKYVVPPPSISMSTLTTCVSLWHYEITVVNGHIPIEDGAAEGTSAARSAEEQVPDGVAESARLGG